MYFASQLAGHKGGLVVRWHTVYGGCLSACKLLRMWCVACMWSAFKEARRVCCWAVLKCMLLGGLLGCPGTWWCMLVYGLQHDVGCFKCVWCDLHLLSQHVLRRCVVVLV